jgi:predicted O-methyltransferase YrrM
MRHFEENTKEFGNKIKLIKQSSAKALKSRELLDQKFDFIYIDGNRHSKHVLEDAVLAFPLLNVNGYIVFDDYTNSRNHDYTCPKKGIDAFLDMYSDELKVIDADWQVIAKKVKPKKTLKPCRSEYYSRL